MSKYKLMKKFGVAIALAATVTVTTPNVVPMFGTTAMVEAAVKISKSKLSLSVGESYKLSVKGTSSKIIWSTSDKKVATVSKTGQVTAKGAGKAKITAKVGKAKYTCTVNVKLFTEAKFNFSDGAGFVYPKGWKVTDLSETMKIDYAVAAKEGSESGILFTCVPNESGISDEKLLTVLYSQITKEYMQQQLQTSAQIDPKLGEIEVPDFKSKKLEVNGAPALYASITATYNKKTMNMSLYCILKDGYIYQVTAIDSNDMKINISQLLDYVVEHVTYIEE